MRPGVPIRRVEEGRGCFAALAAWAAVDLVMAFLCWKLVKGEVMDSRYCGRVTGELHGVFYGLQETITAANETARLQCPRIRCMPCQDQWECIIVIHATCDGGGSSLFGLVCQTNCNPEVRGLRE